MLLIRISKKNQEYFRNLQTTTLSALAGRRMVVRFLASSSCTVWAPLVPLGTGSGLNTYCNTYNTGSQSLSQSILTILSFYDSFISFKERKFYSITSKCSFTKSTKHKILNFNSYGGICIKRISFTYT